MLRLVRKERLQNIVAVLYLAIVGHTIRISHPEAFAPDDAYRRLRGRVVNQPRVGLVWFLLEKRTPLPRRIRHKNICQPYRLIVLFWSENRVESFVSQWVLLATTL